MLTPCFDPINYLMDDYNSDKKMKTVLNRVAKERFARLVI